VFLVVAVAGPWQEGGVIGKDGTMPWHLPLDLRRFKALTMGQSGRGWPMVMGRKTFESLPGVLPGRRHIVLTRDPTWTEDGAEVVHSPAQALALANSSHVAIVGGAEIYQLFLPLADRIEWTEVHASPAGDTHFPAFDRSGWQETFRESHPAEGRSPGFDFVTLVRKP
jgi:dihydrofolate reductase